MKMFYGNIPVNSMKIKHYEMNTNSATVQPSDLQTGVTCFGRGKKITGTGKSFEFAQYGYLETNLSRTIPNNINVIEIASLTYPIQLNIALSDMKGIDFTKSQTVANVTVDGVSYPISVQVSNNKLTVSCDKTIKLQVFYGKDNYVL